MTIFDIIPAIDLLDGGVVRLTQGDYDDVTNYSSDPVELAQSFESEGAKRLHLVDLNGAKDGTTSNFKVIKAIRKATSIEIEIGGGIRSKESIDNYLNIGINQVILGSILVNDFTLAKQLILDYPNKIIAGLDIKNGYIAVHGWTEKSKYKMEDFIEKINSLPIHSIIYTDISKDGMMSGPDFTGLETYSKLSKIPLIASGGVRGLNDIVQLQKINNVSGAIIGKAVLSGTVCLSDLL